MRLRNRTHNIGAGDEVSGSKKINFGKYLYFLLLIAILIFAAVKWGR